jgi:hypothetical protein
MDFQGSHISQVIDYMFLVNITAVRLYSQARLMDIHQVRDTHNYIENLGW